MTYSGDVVVDGPAEVRELEGLTIRKLAVGPMSNNAYLLTCTRQGAQVLIDPADDSDALLELVRSGSVATRLDLIVVTHRHADHIGALDSLVTVTGAPVATGAQDADSIQRQTEVAVHRRLRNGDIITFGACTLSVVHLRGHTSGSIALVYRDGTGSPHIFTGDSLFPGGVGKTASDEDFSSLIDDVESRIFNEFDDETWVYPGHGADTTVGSERPNVMSWRQRGW